MFRPRRPSPVPRTGTPAMRAGRGWCRRETTTLAFRSTSFILLRHNCFKVLVAVFALAIFCPTSKLPITVDTATFDQQLAILHVIAEALCMPGKFPGARCNRPFRHIVPVPQARMWLTKGRTRKLKQLEVLVAMRHPAKLPDVGNGSPISILIWAQRNFSLGDRWGR